MYLTIDGHEIDTRTDEKLLDLICRLKLQGNSLADRPLAAKIAGEVFTLNYIPQRSKDTAPDRPSIRRAMAASNGVVHLLRYGDAAGRDCYIRTAQFVIFLALRQLWPEARGKMNCTLGSSVYIEVEGADNFSVSRLKRKITELVEEDEKKRSNRLWLRWKRLWHAIGRQDRRIRQDFYPGGKRTISMNISMEILLTTIMVK